MTIHSTLFDIYSLLLSRKRFYKINRALFHASARGMGILNYKNTIVSGERAFLRKYLGPLASPTVVDVGANEGNYCDSIYSANPASRVIAFEPHPNTFARLASRLSHRPGFIGVNAACAGRSGSAVLYDHKGAKGSGHASLYSGAIESIHRDQSEQYRVELVDLDSALSHRGVSSIHLLKIDTEGNELEVLKGASRLLNADSIQAIQFEFNEMNVVSRVFMKDFYDLLPNYKFFRMLRDGLVPLGIYSPLWCEIYAFQNIVALLNRDVRS